ncbi:hypothetical protein EON66_03120 [archaeon]|nr:MAG: hypothetical protein EON66_03120 [archaeon]
MPPLGVCSVAAAPRSSPDVNDSLTLSPSTEQRTRVAAPQSAGSVDTEADASVQSSVRRLDWSTDDAAPDVATAVVDTCADGGSCAEAQPVARVVSKYVKQRAHVEVPISVTVCPVSRILISPSYPRECADCCAPPALTHTVSSSSSSSSGGGGSGSGGASTTSQPSASMFLSELGEDAANTLLCCGGTSIPQAHLAAMLWRRHWQYRVRVAGRASMAEEVLHMAVSRLISTRADDQWVLLAWDVLPSSTPCNTPQPSCASAGSAPTTSDEATQHTTTRAAEECDDEDARAPHATCASVAQAHPPRLRRALFMKVVDVARVHSSPAHELRCSRANEAVSHVFRTTCVLQQEVRVDWPAGAEAAEGRVWINFWVEPQDGFSLGTRASASKRTILSTRALYTMYANAIYASDVDILRSELHTATVTDSAFATGVGGHDGSVLPQPGACTPTLEVHAFDALNHTVDVRGEALLRVSQAHTVTSSGAQRAAAAAAQPAFATAVPAHLQLLTQASHSSSGSLNSGSMSAMTASRVGQGAPPPMSNVATAALPHLQLPSPPPLLPGFELCLVPQQPLLGQIIAPRTATAAAASGCAATLCAASDVGGASCVWPVSRVGDSQFGAIASVTWHASEQGMMREQRT